VKSDVEDSSKSVEKIEIYLRSDKNIGHFIMRRPEYGLLLPATSNRNIRMKWCQAVGIAE
jgi:hypothetical protein